MLPPNGGWAQGACRREGFLIEGKMQMIPAGGGDVIEQNVEILTRHEPFGARAAVHGQDRRAHGETVALNEMLMIINGERACRRA